MGSCPKQRANFHTGPTFSCSDIHNAVCLDRENRFSCHEMLQGIFESAKNNKIEQPNLPIAKYAKILLCMRKYLG